MDRTFLVVLLVIVCFVALFLLYRHNFKRIVVGCVTLITGAVKTGKSLLGVYLAVRKYRSQHLKWWVSVHIFKKEKEEPLFYTNTFVTFGHFNPKKSLSKRNKKHRLDKNIRVLELEHLMRLKRFNYGSVIYIDESSLLSDSQDFNNQIRNACLSLFNKLIGHETKGGYLFYDTQSIDDNHYSIDRVISNFHFIQKSRNFLLFRVLYVRELISKNLGENTFDKDVDLSMRKIIIGRWWYHRYDRYYFSYLTDDLPSDSVDLEFYSGCLRSFNPLYRKLSLMNEEMRNFLLKEFDKMTVEREQKYFERKGLHL